MCNSAFLTLITHALQRLTHLPQSYIFCNFNPILHLSCGSHLASSTSYVGTAYHQQVTEGFYYEGSPLLKWQLSLKWKKLLTTTNVKLINVLFPSFSFRVAVVLPHVPSALVVFGLMLIRRGWNTDRITSKTFSCHSESIVSFSSSLRLEELVMKMTAGRLSLATTEPRLPELSLHAGNTDANKLPSEALFCWPNTTG